jgi:hypothetical protein
MWEDEGVKAQRFEYNGMAAEVEGTPNHPEILTTYVMSPKSSIM